MKEVFYYILAAISGGVVSEINKPIDKQNMAARHIFAVGMTSVVVGIVFGLGIDHFTGSTKLSVAASALAGVGGFNSLQWVSDLFRKVIERKSSESSETSENS